MFGISNDALAEIIVMLVLAVIGFLSWLFYVKPRWEQRYAKQCKLKEAHLNDMISILQELRMLVIDYNNFKIEILIIGGTASSDFHESPELSLALQHLKTQNWNKIRESVKRINNDFKDLENYVKNRIKTEIIDDYNHELFDTIWDITKKILSKEVINKIEPNELEIQTEPSNSSFSVSFDSDRPWHLHVKKIGKNEIKTFLLNVINDTEYQDKLGTVKTKIEPTKRDFDDFQKYLTDLLKLSEIELQRELSKMKCDKCKSFLRKWWVIIFI